MQKIILVLIFITFLAAFFYFKSSFQFEVPIIEKAKPPDVSGEVKEFQPYQYAIKGITLNITHPLSYPNLRWANMPVLVKIDSSTCNPSRANDVRYAMNLWEEKTGVVSFREAEDYQVWVNCTAETESRKEEGFIITKVGEGGPTKILPTDYFNLSISGYAKIVSTTKDCIKPVRILHEFGHVLGLDHVNDSKSILYPYEDCQQDFTPEILQTMSELYKVEALPDLYFVNASASSFGQYLNVSFVVRNGGILSSAPTKIKIRSNTTDIQDYALDSIEPGRGLSIMLANVRIARISDQIVLAVDQENSIKEYDEENNIVVLQTG